MYFLSDFARSLPGKGFRERADFARSSADELFIPPDFANNTEFFRGKDTKKRKSKISAQKILGAGIGIATIGGTGLYLASKYQKKNLSSQAQNNISNSKGGAIVLVSRKRNRNTTSPINSNKVLVTPAPKKKRGRPKKKVN